MKKLIAVSLATAFAAFGAQAESNTTYSDSQVQARLKFSVVIPKVIALQVGSTGGTQDTLTYTVQNNNLGNGAEVLAANNGETTGGAVKVRITSNAGGTLKLNSNVSQLKLTSGSGTIPWSEIAVESAKPTNVASGFAAATIPHPTFNTDQGPGTEQQIAGANQATIKQEGLWTFKYKNATTPLAGTYEGTATYTLAAQ